MKRTTSRHGRVKLTYAAGQFSARRYRTGKLQMHIDQGRAENVLTSPP